MTDREKELQQYLEGLHAFMPEPFWKLAEILELQALELCKAKNGKDYLIPYMLNDAVEDYLILRNGSMTGEYLPETNVLFPARIVEEPQYLGNMETVYVLVIRQEGGNTFTLRFDGIEERIQCYQYHRIGHFWVKGQEQWRQLVYMVGIIHDKYEYIGENVCNEKEIALMPLIEFPPFRFWSPIHESLDEKYPFTYDGIDAMKELAKEAGDKNYARMLRVYRKFPNPFLGKLLCRRLALPKSEVLYCLIQQKLEEASKEYGIREYESGLNGEMDRKRAEIDGLLHEKGFYGQYPYYEKEEMRVVVTEEHPFTREEFEYEDYEFRMKFMVSKVEKRRFRGWNSGFFRGDGRQGYIVEDIEELF